QREVVERAVHRLIGEPAHAVAAVAELLAEVVELRPGLVAGGTAHAGGAGEGRDGFRSAAPGEHGGQSHGREDPRVHLGSYLKSMVTEAGLPAATVTLAVR